jgi:hypothetical protein
MDSLFPTVYPKIILKAPLLSLQMLLAALLKHINFSNSREIQLLLLTYGKNSTLNQLARSLIN